ncbi:MAG: hypothetical protein FJW31_07735 [Acidobacteria bacterium]|nr:hypothetical protein [Acidobacteriota bacterium]
MALTETDDGGRIREVRTLPHRGDFDRTWLAIAAKDRVAIEAEINDRLDRIVASPDPNWGSITNTSIEGGKLNTVTEIRGDWTGTVFDAIFQACNLNEDLAGMFYGNVWKKVIIEASSEEFVGSWANPNH